LDEGVISFGVNGNWNAPFGACFSNISVAGGVVPAVSLGSKGSLTLTLSFGGRSSLAFGPPSRLYEPLASSGHPTRAPALMASRSLLGFDQPHIRAYVSSGYHAAQLHTDDTGVVSLSASSHMPSVIAQGVYLTAGKWQYEVTVTRAGRAALGWATSDFFGSWEACVGVGGCPASWGFGYDGRASVTVHDGKPHAFGQKWHLNDVIGVAVDLATGAVTYALNGAVVEPFGVAPGLTVAVPPAGWVVPALSYRSDFTGLLNLGAHGLRFPLEGYAPVAAFTP